MDAARGILTARALNQETTVRIKESIVSEPSETCRFLSHSAITIIRALSARGGSLIEVNILDL
jgi:hypothetical protein